MNNPFSSLDTVSFIILKTHWTHHSGEMICKFKRFIICTCIRCFFPEIFPPYKLWKNTCCCFRNHRKRHFSFRSISIVPSIYRVFMKPRNLWFNPIILHRMDFFDFWFIHIYSDLENTRIKVSMSDLDWGYISSHSSECGRNISQPFING